MASGNLRIIFHGQFAFVVHSECLEVLIPEVAPNGAIPGHTYRASTAAAGNGAAANLTLAFGATYQLRCVGGDSAITRFARQLFPVVEGYRVIDRSSRRLHGSIYLPFPNSVTGLRRLQPDGKKFFAGAAASQISAESIPTLYVLSYSVENSAYLDDWPIPGNTLHIFAEPATNIALPLAHAKDAFSKSARLFPSLDLRLLDYDWANLETAANGNRVRVTPDEARSLIEAQAQIALQQQHPVQPALPLCIPLVVDNS